MTCCTVFLLYQVPVRMLVQPSPTAGGQLPPSLELPRLLLQDKRLEVPLPPGLSMDLSRGAFLKLNPGFHSYFRADYRYVYQRIKDFKERFSRPRFGLFRIRILPILKGVSRKIFRISFDIIDKSRPEQELRLVLKFVSHFSDLIQN